MEKITSIGIKNSVTLPSLANKFFNSLRDENDEPIYTCNDEYNRWFVRQNIKGGRNGSFNQWYGSSLSDSVFNIISKELDVNGNICETLDKYFEFTKKT